MLRVTHTLLSNQAKLDSRNLNVGAWGIPLKWEANHLRACCIPFKMHKTMAKMVLDKMPCNSDLTSPEPWLPHACGSIECPFLHPSHTLPIRSSHCWCSTAKGIHKLPIRSSYCWCSTAKGIIAGIMRTLLYTIHGWICEKEWLKNLSSWFLPA